MKELINTLEGNILLINVSDILKKQTNKNNKIVETYYLDKINKKKYKCNSQETQKNIKISKLSKIFNKKSINYTIINFDELLDKKRDLIKQSIVLTNKDIIIYGKIDNYQKERILKIYRRYTDYIKSYKDYTIITINNKKYNNIFNIFYYIIDIIYDFIDILGTGLME